MLEKSFGLFFFLKQPKNQENAARYVYLRITVDGTSKELSTKRLWQRDRWNQDAGRATGTKEDAKTLNSYLDALCAKVYQTKALLIESNKPVNAESLKNAVTGQDGERKMLLEIFMQHNKQVEALVGIDYVHATFGRYRTTYDHTKAFIQWKYNVDDLEINDLDYEFVEQFAFWLKAFRHCGHNAAMKYISNVKKLILQCINIGDQLLGVTISNPKNPCEGTPVTLNYQPNINFHQGNLYQWLKNKDTIAITPTGTTTVFTSGYYWAHVSDQYGCTDNAAADTVNITQMPPVDIYGNSDACIDEDYSMSGYAGAGATYRWFENTVLIPGATLPTLTTNKPSPASFSYTVEVTIPKPGGGFCTKLSDPFVVTVHGNPAPPTISFNVVNCNPYEVQLTANPMLPGTYNWSNGASGNPVIVPLGGPF